MKKHAEKDFVPFLNDLESFLFQQGFSKITIAANAANANAINLFLYSSRHSTVGCKIILSGKILLVDLSRE
jgi:hypothetical protein